MTSAWDKKTSNFIQEIKNISLTASCHPANAQNIEFLHIGHFLVTYSRPVKGGGGLKTCSIKEDPYLDTFLKI